VKKAVIQMPTKEYASIKATWKLDMQNRAAKHEKQVSFSTWLLIHVENDIGSEKCYERQQAMQNRKIAIEKLAEQRALIAQVAQNDHCKTCMSNPANNPNALQSGDVPCQWCKWSPTKVTC
jgi:hypothetical protein